MPAAVFHDQDIKEQEREVKAGNLKYKKPSRRHKGIIQCYRRLRHQIVNGYKTKLRNDRNSLRNKSEHHNSFEQLMHFHNGSSLDPSLLKTIANGKLFLKSSMKTKAKCCN